MQRSRVASIVARAGSEGEGEMSRAGVCVRILDELLATVAAEVALQTHMECVRGEVCLTCTPYCERELVTQPGLDVFGRDSAMVASAGGSSGGSRGGRDDDDDDDDDDGGDEDGDGDQDGGHDGSGGKGRRGAAAVLPSASRPLPASTQYVACELCSRSVAVSRFAAHLASCLGLGRAGRAAPRRSAAEKVPSGRYVETAAAPLVPYAGFDPLQTPTEADLARVLRDPDVDWKQVEEYISTTSKAAANTQALAEAAEAQAKAAAAAEAAKAAAARKRAAEEAAAAAAQAARAAEAAAAAAHMAVAARGGAGGGEGRRRRRSVVAGSQHMGSIATYALMGMSEEMLADGNLFRQFMARYNERLKATAASAVLMDDDILTDAFSVANMGDINSNTQLRQLTPGAVAQLLTKVCGVVNMGTRKMCSNSLKCPQHNAVTRAVVRFKLAGVPALGTGADASAATRNELEMIHVILDEEWTHISPPARRRGRPKKNPDE